MKPVFLASPFSAPDAQTLRRHINYAKRAAEHSILQGEAPFIPHLLYPRFLDDNLPDSRELAIAMGTAWLARAEALVVYADLGLSPGMSAEISVAALLKLPTEIRYIGAPAIRKAPSEPSEIDIDNKENEENA